MITKVCSGSFQTFPSGRILFFLSPGYKNAVDPAFSNVITAALRLDSTQILAWGPSDASYRANRSLVENFNLTFGHDFNLSFVVLTPHTVGWLAENGPHDTVENILRTLPGEPFIAYLDGETEHEELRRLAKLKPDVELFGFRDVLHDEKLRLIFNASKTKLFSYSGGGLIAAELYENFVPGTGFSPCVFRTCAWVTGKNANSILTGFANGNYPTRVRMLEAIQAKKIDVTLFNHPGYAGANFTEAHAAFRTALRVHKFCLIGKRHDYALTKYFEAAAARCAIIGDIPQDNVLRKLIFRNISNNISDDQFVLVVNESIHSWAFDDATLFHVELARYVVLSLYSAHSILLNFILPALAHFQNGVRGVWLPARRCFEHPSDFMSKVACRLTEGKIVSTTKIRSTCCVAEVETSGRFGNGFASEYLNMSAVQQFLDELERRGHMHLL